MLWVTDLSVEINSRNTSTYDEELTVLTQTGNNFLLKPVELLLPFMGVGSGDAVIEDNQIRTGSVNLSAHTESLYRRVFFRGVTRLGTQIHSVSTPCLSVFFPAAGRSIGVLHL